LDSNYPNDTPRATTQTTPPEQLPKQHPQSNYPNNTPIAHYNDVIAGNTKGVQDSADRAQFEYDDKSGRENDSSDASGGVTQATSAGHHEGGDRSGRAGVAHDPGHALVQRGRSVATYNDTTPIPHYNDAIVGDTSRVQDSADMPLDDNDLVCKIACDARQRHGPLPRSHSTARCEVKSAWHKRRHHVRKTHMQEYPSNLSLTHRFEDVSDNICGVPDSVYVLHHEILYEIIKDIPTGHARR
jgi:hypothetical protein